MITFSVSNDVADTLVTALAETKGRLLEKINVLNSFSNAHQNHRLLVTTNAAEEDYSTLNEVVEAGLKAVTEAANRELASIDNALSNLRDT